MPFITAAGHRLEYELIAPERTAARWLVFLHEGLGSIAMWRDFPSRLCEAVGCRGLVYSRFGYGRSDPLTAPRRVDFMHDEALETLPTLLAEGGRRPELLPLPGYHKLKRERVDAVDTVRLSAADVVIVEGTVALFLEPPASVETHRLYVEIGEETRKRRVLGEYRLRGVTEADALAVYLARRTDEVPLIEDSARAARRVALSSILADQ